MSDYLIKEETLNNLANSVRAVSGESAEMTPDQMVMTMNNTKSAMDALDEHINDKNNPHDVTAEQVGAAKTDLSNVSNTDMLAKIQAAGFSAGAKIASGSYTGDGNLSKTVTIGFEPKFFISMRQPYGNAQYTIYSGQPGESKAATGRRLYSVTSTSITIKVVSADYTTEYNESGTVYYWVAIG